jgi:hypothetical protein
MYLIATFAFPARGNVTSGEVEQAIRSGIGFLRASQAADGSWPGMLGMMEVTELTTMAMLTAGVAPDDPDLARALAIVRQHDPEKIAAGQRTYTVALRAMVLAIADAAAYRELIARDADWLIKAQLRHSPVAGIGGLLGGMPSGALDRGRRLPGRPQRLPAPVPLSPPGAVAGSWTYNESGPRIGDNSNTQYALLGLNAASEAGIVIPAEVWIAARRHWEWCQNADGGWGYTGHQPSTSSMTAAGISSLVITGSRLSHSSEVLDGAEIKHCGSAEVAIDVPLQRGLEWLTAHFSVHENVGGRRQLGPGFMVVRERPAPTDLYYLYGLERAGRLSGRRFFGTHDWYREGAELLVGLQQRETGAWEGVYGPVISTSFALLFLAKGRAPVLINKLRHAPHGDWNNDPKEVGNLVGAVARDWKSLLTWQIVDSDAATVEELLQAPIIYVNGHEAPVFDERGKKNLRDAIEQGGFLLAEACCSRPGFDQGFRALMKQLFPDPGDDLHLLGAEHPIWRAKYPLDSRVRPLWGIERGCRTVVVYAPEDLSCYWNQAESSPSNPAVIWALKLGQNIVDYATGRETPADKLVVRTVVDLTTEVPKRGALRIAKLKHAGEWNIASRAIPNLMDVLRKPPLGFDVVLSQKDLAPSDPSLVNYPLIYLHGRTAFDLSDDLVVLRRHLEPGGGTIFADAACGSPAFDAAFRRLIAALLPRNPLVPIPHDDEIYALKVGFDLSKVQYSPAASGHRGYPQLEGVKLSGHWAVIYSKYDLGCALEHHQGLDCKGYTHESAQRIAANIVIYSTMP